jgi:ribosome biogenesis GTPase
MAFGTVLRSHAGGYLVFQSEQNTVYLCTARGRIKKEGLSILTGDEVELDEINPDLKTAVIAARKDRQNILSRPPVANVDQAIIVQAVHQPEWSALICDRYVVHFQLELPGAPPVLCFNKCDLASPARITALRSIYEPLGYFVTFVSAKTGVGMDDLVKRMSGKISVMAGPSGVGKSSLLNSLVPELKLKIGRMENEFGVGRHTTTSSELYNIGPIEKYFGVGSGKGSWVADTPGFNILELRHPEPSMVVWQFPEILELAHDCKFLNCLHLVEQGCNVLQNIEKIPHERFESYCAIVGDAQAEYKFRKDSSQKTETSVKSVGGGGKAKQVPKLSGKYRMISRRSKNQKIDVDEDEDDDDGEDEDDVRNDGDVQDANDVQSAVDVQNDDAV